MDIPFTKMQALGNDFVLIEEKELKFPLTKSQIQHIAHRRKGIGCDQVILIKPSDAADAEISFYNADGSKAEACGNGTRCVALYLNKSSGQIQTPSFLSQFYKRGRTISASLKPPVFHSLEQSPYRVDVGNPHIVQFADQLNHEALEKFVHSFHYPQGINAELAQIVSPSVIRVLVWERGAGITPACGSGACAVGVISSKLGLVKKGPLSIEMEGGTLTVDWEEGSPLFLTGPASFCFKGTIDLP